MFIVVDVVVYCDVLKELHAYLSLLMFWFIVMFWRNYMQVYCCWCSGLLSCFEGITCMFIVVDV